MILNNMKVEQTLYLRLSQLPVFRRSKGETQSSAVVNYVRNPGLRHTECAQYQIKQLRLGLPFLSLNLLNFSSLVLRNLDYSCLYHWIIAVGSTEIIRNCVHGRSFRIMPSVPLHEVI